MVSGETIEQGEDVEAADVLFDELLADDGEVLEMELTVGVGIGVMIGVIGKAVAAPVMEEGAGDGFTSSNDSQWLLNILSRSSSEICNSFPVRPAFTRTSVIGIRFIGWLERL